jgi:hypothetical protein
MHLLALSAPALALLALLLPSPVEEPANLPPVGFPTGTYQYACQGQTTSIALDGSSVYDPEGDAMSFEWTSGCPGQVILDPTAQVTTLLVDTSGSCTVNCSVRLRISDGVNVTFARFFIEIGGPIVAEFDIHPGSCPNPVQTTGNGVVPAALIGTLSFDIDLVDRTSLRLARADGIGGSVAPIHFSKSDVAVPFVDNDCDCHTLIQDGLPDLALKFNKKSMVEALQLASQPNKSYVPLVITGNLLSGEAFSARDCIRVQL